MNALDPRDVQALGFSLLHFVWQGMALAALLAGLNLLLRHAAPQVRYLLAAATLGAMLVAPVLTFQALRRGALEAPAGPAARVGESQSPVSGGEHEGPPQGPQAQPPFAPPRRPGSERDCASGSSRGFPCSSPSGARGCSFSPCARSAASPSCNGSSGRSCLRRPPWSWKPWAASARPCGSPPPCRSSSRRSCTPPRSSAASARSCWCPRVHSPASPRSSSS